MNYKYTLIISQYYHSRHAFIVLFNKDTFIENAKKFVIELEKYKRSNEGLEEEANKGEYLGDLSYFDSNEIRPRYNINDAGDIYFINSKYANYCKDVAIEYHEDSRRESAGFKKKAVIQAISEHHNYNKVKEILEKYFEIA